MTSLNEIEQFLNIVIGDRLMRKGLNMPNKNRYYRFEYYLVVELSQDKYMVVDSTRDVKKLLRKHIWYYHMGYAGTRINSNIKRFHQLFLNYNNRHVADHINRNKYDNRFENLRVVSPRENMRNKTKRYNNRSGYTGISECVTNGISYYRAFTSNNNNHQLVKCFNINKIGREEALQLAIAQRRAWVEEFGYTHD